MFPQSVGSGLSEKLSPEECRNRRPADGLCAGDVMAYMTAQGGANVARDEQTTCVACRVANELNTCDEEVKKVVGIFVPHPGESHVDETRSTR